LTLIMEKFGVPVICAEDGVEALEQAAAHPVALVFMDIQMPRMNGYEAAAELRRRGFTKPLIAVTAGALAEERRKCREAGFDDILPKPFKRLGVQAMYRRWSAGGRASPAEEGACPAEEKGEALRDPVVFSREELLDTFMNDEKTARSLLDRFVRRSAGEIRTLPGLVEDRRWEEAYRMVHTIKGTAMTLSGMELGKAAGRLGRALQEEDPQSAALFPPLRKAFDRFQNAVEAWLEKTEENP
jgi:CheY-like chemotaxis protein/HPt (histidine-containing phosphotransfer) domain-containing protein